MLVPKLKRLRATPRTPAARFEAIARPETAGPVMGTTCTSMSAGATMAGLAGAMMVLLLLPTVGCAECEMWDGVGPSTEASVTPKKLLVA